jgi:hypothetical protein
MAMECILCFAVMKKLETGARGDEAPADGWVGGRTLHEDGGGRSPLFDRPIPKG